MTAPFALAFDPLHRRVKQWAQRGGGLIAPPGNVELPVALAHHFRRERRIQLGKTEACLDRVIGVIHIQPKIAEGFL